MTAADELRQAAALLRALLADPELTPGPWLSLDHGDRLLYNGPGAEDEPPVYVVDEPMSNGANADYIEAMHPGVGLALAAWLEDTADLAESVGRSRPDAAWLAPALAVARQIVGEEAQP